ERPVPIRRARRRGALDHRRGPRARERAPARAPRVRSLNRRRYTRKTVDEGMRYRCGACGNLTRFDVIARKRTRAFFHFSIGGELSVEEDELLDEQVERVVCRWCGSADQIETIPRVAAE